MFQGLHNRRLYLVSQARRKPGARPLGPSAVGARRARLDDSARVDCRQTSDATSCSPTQKKSRGGSRGSGGRPATYAPGRTRGVGIESAPVEVEISLLQVQADRATAEHGELADRPCDPDASARRRHAFFLRDDVAPAVPSLTPAQAYRPWIDKHDVTGLKRKDIDIDTVIRESGLPLVDVG